MNERVEISRRAAEILKELLEQCVFSVRSEDGAYAEAKEVYEEISQVLGEE